MDRFTDGYIDWRGFDEDGEEYEGTAELRSAEIDTDTLSAELEYDDGVYLLTMKRQGKVWHGTWKATFSDLKKAGRCFASETGDGKVQRTFEGRWIEDDLSFQWVFVLRGATRKRAKTRAAAAAKSATLDDPTRSKVRLLIGVAEALLRGAETRHEVTEVLVAAWNSIDGMRIARRDR